MKRNLVALAALALLVVPAAHARPVTSPGVVHLYGDSITKGYGFAEYDFPSFLERIDLTANEMTGEAKFIREAPLQDPGVVCQDRLAWGDSDSAVLEDAGPHPAQAAVYQTWLAALGKCAPGLTFTTMFDYNPNPVTTPLSRYDDPFPDSPMTGNDAFRQAARIEHTTTLDWNTLMDKARATFEPQGVHVVNPADGIHPTVFGNIVLAASVVRGQGITKIATATVVEELMTQQAAIVGRGFAPPFTRDQAQAWVTALAG